MENNDQVPVRELWLRVFNEVRASVDVATVWLAMQAATPITVDGHYFVAGLPAEDEYLAGNLQNHEATSAIEEALQKITGRVLAFHLISGTTLADWERSRPADAAQAHSAYAPNYGDARPDAVVPPPAASIAAPSSPTVAAPRPSTSPTMAADPSESWEKLGERLTLTYKSSPVKFAQGQARVILRAARMISDTMDLLMPAPGQPTDDVQDRALSRVIERFGSLINLDPIFISLELMRFREVNGKELF